MVAIAKIRLAATAAVEVTDAALAILTAALKAWADGAAALRAAEAATEGSCVI